MLEDFVNVASEVVILFILILVGFICGKGGILKDKAIGSMSDLVLTVATPCIIVISFQREFELAMLKGIFEVMVFAALIMGLNIVLSTLLIHDKDISCECVLRFGSIISNCGFMGIPLIYAILGSDGVFYISAYIAVLNLISWSYGVALMNKGRGKQKVSIVKVFLNPGILGTVVALILYFFSISLPSVMYTAVNYLGELNTPLPMLIIGFQLSKVSLIDVFKGANQYLAVFIRLVLVPAIVAIVFIVFKVDETIAVVCIVAASAPSGAFTTMFSNKYNRDVILSVKLVSVSTLLSIITMPLIVGSVQYFLG